MVSFCAGHAALKLIFQYLDFTELLTAKRVCKVWKEFSEQPLLWKKLQTTNRQLTTALADILNRHGTEHIQVLSEGDDWETFVESVSLIKSLRVIELLNTCSSIVVEEIVRNCPHLQVITASSIDCKSLNANSFRNLYSPRKLHLRAVTSMSLEGDLSFLLGFAELTHLVSIVQLEFNIFLRNTWCS